jgi:hypothetical protein
LLVIKVVTDKAGMILYWMMTESYSTIRLVEKDINLESVVTDKIANIIERETDPGGLTLGRKASTVKTG